VKIEKARNAGYCFGVQRAIDMVEEALKINHGTMVYCLGALTHNPQMVAQLEKKGFKIVEELDEIPDGSLFAIRSHGTTKKIKARAKAKDLKIIDASCPYVKIAQKTAAELSTHCDQVIICGDPQHAEVISLNSYTDNSALIIQELSELPEIQNNKVYGILSQTTQRRERLNKIVDQIEKLAKQVIVKNTICDATRIRQNEVKKLADQVDILIVVGGKSSSNTTKLAQIGAAQETETHHIETAKELKKKWFKDVDRVGVAAGASTPQFLIDEVLRKIEKL